LEAIGPEKPFRAKNMILLTTFYLESNQSRRAELMECLQLNVVNPWLDEIHLFIEEIIPLDELCAAYPQLACKKIRLISQRRRVKYEDLFSYANRNLPGCTIIISNADIYFNHTLARLHGYDLAGKLFCLSRWDMQRDGTARFFNHPFSQDAWIFQSPIREFRSDFHMGLLSCDNRLAWEAGQVGLELLNPGQSIQALHLHHSQVRHYSENERLRGPVKEVCSAYLGTPWLWFVVPCMGRLDLVRETVASLLDQSQSSSVLVDYSCPDGVREWARATHPKIIVVRVQGRHRFRAAEAKNLGAAEVTEDGLLCFLDANIRLAPGFSNAILSRYEEGLFLIPDRHDPGCESILVCSKKAFDLAGGFDEAFLDWGGESDDLKSTLSRLGFAERRFPAELVAPVLDCKSTYDLCLIKDQTARQSVQTAYRSAKLATMADAGGNGPSLKARRELYNSIMCRYLTVAELASDLPLAMAAFSETMGYCIKRLDLGTSSHTNDPRPFTRIAESLHGLQFTQVVASVVSPIEIQFITSGKLYLLLGTDWYGYDILKNWLSERGFRENVPLVETEKGSSFEVWSLIADAGDCFTVPTQVMLVGDHLLRK
jgi:hypothetical protein